MKKNKNNDAQKTAELLQKLQAAVLSSSRKKEKKQESPDRDEIEFQKKLASMLDRVTAGIDTKASPSENSSDEPKDDKESAPAEELFATEEADTSEAVAVEESIPPKKEKKPKREKRKEAAREKNKEEPLVPDESPLAKLDSAEDKAPFEEEQSTEETAFKEEIPPLGEITPAEESPITEEVAPIEESQTTEELAPAEQESLAEQKRSKTEPTDEPTESARIRKTASPRSIRALTEDAEERAPSHDEELDVTIIEETSPQPSTQKRQENPLHLLTDLSSEAVIAETFKPSEEIPSEETERIEAEVSEQSKAIEPARTEEAEPQTANAETPAPKLSVESKQEKKALPRSEEAKQTEAEPKEMPTPSEPNKQTTATPTAKPKDRQAEQSHRPPRPKAEQEAQKSDRIRIQVSPAKPPQETTPPSRSGTEQHAPPKAPDRIIIPPRTQADAPQRKDLMQKKNEQKAPQVTLPPETRTERSAPASQKQDEPIVVRPKTSAPNAEPIVIKPRRDARTAEPSRVEAPTEPAPRDRQRVSPNGNAPERSEKRAEEARPVESPAPQRKQPAVTVPPTQRAGEKQEKPKKTSSGVSLPRSSASPSHPHKKQPNKRKPRSINRTPIAPLPQDEHLDEVLDDLVTGELTVEMLPVEEPEMLRPEKKSLFSRRKGKKGKQEEQSLGAATVIEKKTGLTEDDIAMIFELGYENELGRLVGYETLKKLKYEHVRRHRRVDHRHWRTAYGYRGHEYTGSQPKENVLAAYIKDRGALIWRLVLSALLTCLLLPLSLPLAFEGLIPSLAQCHPAWLSWLSVLLLGGISLLHLRSLRAGLRSAFRFTPTPYSLNALLIPIALVYGLVSFGITLAGKSALLSIAIPAALSLILIDVCDVLRVAGEMRSFRILSAEGEKTVLDPAEPRKKKLRLGDKIVKIINDDAGQSLYRVRSSEQTSGFFRRFNDFSSAAKPFAILLCTALALAFLGGLASAIRFSSFTSALSGAALTFVCAIPCGAVYLYFHSFNYANRRLATKNCTLVGEESVEEYREEKTVIFDDSDMYAAQRCTQISVREGEDFRRDMQLAGILFRKMSGTLGSVGQNAPAKGSGDPAVAFVRLTENGTEAVVDNRYHLLAGNATFMTRSGVRVPKESTDRAARRGDNVSLMYVAVDGVLKLGYEIEYTVSDTFEELVNLLADADTVTAIQTYDPNLNEEFLRLGRPEGAEYVRVIKPGRYEQETPLEVSDTGAVALGHRFTVVLPPVAANEIHGIRKTGYRLQLLLSFLGALTATAITLAVGTYPMGIGALLPVLYQLLCTVGACILTRVRIKNRLP